jgi:Ca2+-binding EF-hand superfamily protein
MVEALIDTAEELIAVLQPTGATPSANEVEAMLRAVQRLNAAVKRAKNWK